MATNTQIGRNIVFPIYNADGTPFHDLVLRKGVVGSIVMSLGDKITGDVYYINNTLQVTMKEYIVYNDVHYVLVNPPTVVREGIVSDNSDLHGMTKYSFEFYHPMAFLANFPLTDVATKTGEEKYLSQNKSFSWIGKPQDFIDKLNKNLQGTQWYVRKSSRFPQDKDDQLSEVETFDKQTVADALKRGYEIWDIPYVVTTMPTDDPMYLQGKRFLIEYGLPSNEIYASTQDEQLGVPFVFRFGQGVGLKNNSRTPRNNKIVTRIAGNGSEDNIPYGYPQIVWTGNQSWDYTINNDSTAANSYPIYNGIVGGRNVRLIKHPFTRTRLMPSIYSETVNKKVNPYASGYDPTIEIKDYYDAVASVDYPYTNEINPQAPCYEAHEFDDIKPELDADRTLGLISATPLNKDLTPASAWDDTMDDNGEYIQSYFKVKLPQLSFDLYACAAITQEMKINMRSGACIGCTFDVQVDWDAYKASFYDQEGNFVPDGAQRNLEKFPKSNEGQIEVVLQKETNTFGTLMPNIYQYPKAGDIFVFIGISLPLTYITDAEHRLDDAMMSYMLENNVYYFDYPLKFDEAFFYDHPNILEQIRPNSIIRFEYGEDELQLFVKQITIKYENKPLPTYDITLTDNIEVVLNQIGQVADDVEHLSSLISIIRQNYNRSVWAELAKKLSKVQDDTAQGFIRFMQGLQVGGQFVSGILGEGAVFRKDADGKTYLEADKMYVRMKAYFDNVEIRDYRHTGGNRIASQARGFTVSRVEWLDSNGGVLEPIQSNLSSCVKFRIYWRAKDDEHETQNDFIVGDMAFSHYSDVEDGTLETKRYWRLVVGRNIALTEEGEAWIDLSNETSATIQYIDLQGVSRSMTRKGYEDGSDIPNAEDDVCQLGNVWNEERQGAIIEYVGGENAPSYQIYQGIGSDVSNPYTLNGKNYVGLGYNSQTGRAYLNVFGDAYIGDPNGSTFINYHIENGTPTLDIKAKINAQSTIGNTSLPDYIKANQNNFDPRAILDAIDDLQDQVDNQIETWYGNGEPTGNNDPLKNLTPAEKEKHIGDLYYDRTTNHAFRFMNNGTAQSPVYVWDELQDTDVTKALALAGEKKRVFLSQPTTNDVYDVGDLWVNATYPATGTKTYDNDILRCVTAKAKGTAFDISHWQKASKYTDDSALDAFKLDQYVQQLIGGTITGDIATAQGTANNALSNAATAQGTANNALSNAATAQGTANNALSNAATAQSTADGAASAAAALGYLQQALAKDTIIDGGLVLSTLIGLRDSNDTVWAGMNGAYQTAETGTGYKGHGIAAWYGGIMADKEVNNVSNAAKTLFRFDGSGYLASGNITWDKNGIVTIANVYSNVNGQNIPWSGTTLQYINNLATLLPTRLVGSVNYLDPQVSFYNLSVQGKAVATQEWVGQNYVSIGFFNRLFRAFNGTTQVNANDVTTTIDNIKAMVGLWTEQYISAMGQNSSGGSGGATTLSDLLDVNISSPTNGQVLKYNSSTGRWYNGTDEGVTSLAWTNITGKPTTIAGYGITDAKITNGTITLGSNSITPITSLSGYATETWVNNKGYLTSVPAATASALGGIKVGYTTSGKNYKVQLDSSNNAYVNVPWENTNTTYSAGTGISLSGTTFSNSGVRATTINGNYLRVNTNGTNADLTIPYATSAGNADTVDSEHANAFAHRAASNNLVHAGNEITMIPDSYSGSLWFNYQSVGRNSSSNITEYVFGNGKGGQLARISFGQFSGNAATASSVAWSGVTGKPSTFTPSSGSGYYVNRLARWSSGSGQNVDDIVNGTTFAYRNHGAPVSGTIVAFSSQSNSYQLQIQGQYNGKALYYRHKNGDNDTWNDWTRILDAANSSVSLSGSTLTVEINGTSQSLTNTNTWRGIQDNLTSSSNTTESLSAKQGYLLANGSARDSTKLPLAGGTMTGALTVNSSIHASYLGVNQTGGSGAGLSLYNGATTSAPTYGIMFATTGNFGKHGDVTSDWATYFTMSDTTTRGWIFRRGSTNVASVSGNGHIYCAGNVVASGGVTALSDIRHKTILSDTRISVEQIAKMRSVVYKWNDGREDNGLHVGSIAQDWQCVMPEVVLRANDKQGTLSLSYGVAALVSAITTARKVIDHERRIKELEKENERLRTEVEQMRLTKIA